MDSILLAARLVLSAVFFVAAPAKLADKTGSRQMLINFGVPIALASLLAVILSLSELAVAAALLPVVSAWFGAVGALFLLATFILAISINLLRGRKPDCNCFGQIRSAPIGASTLARNVVLAALAALIVLQGRDNAGLSTVGWLSAFTAVQRIGFFCGLAGLMLLGGQAALLLQVLRQQGRLLLRFDSLEGRLTQTGVAPVSPAIPAGPAMGLPVGVPAPGFQLKDIEGDTVGLDALKAAGKPVLLLFTNPNCGPCLALMPEVVGWRRDHAAALTVALIAEGTAEDNRTKIAALGEQLQLLLQPERDVADAYQAYGTPAAVLVDADGTIGSAVAQGADAIRTLVARALDGGRPAAPCALPLMADENGQGRSRVPSASPLKIGALAPSLRFSGLDDQPVSLTDFIGRETLLLFWNPSCGFCQQMMDDLKAWEVNQSSDGPRLLLISTGTAEENRAMNLRSPVVLDHNFQAGAAFGAGGTPLGVLLDRAGRIASGVAAGAQAVLALAAAQLSEEMQPTLVT
jgi:peroxiredoxin